MILNLWKEERCLVEFATECGYYGNVIIEELRESTVVFLQVLTGMRMEIGYTEILGIGKMISKQAIKDQLFPEGMVPILQFIPDGE